MGNLFRLGVIVELIERVTGPARRVIGAIAGIENVTQKAVAITALAGQLGMAGVATTQAADQWRRATLGIIQPTMQVQDSLAALSTVTTSTMGGIEQSLEATRLAAMDWSRTYSDTAAKFLQTSTILASAGLNDVQAIEGTRVALTVARATMADTADTANTLATMYNNLGDKGADVRTEMTRLGDIMAKTQALYQIPTLGALAEGLKYATPSAIQFGTGIEELNVALGALNTAGLQGGQAGTAYSAAMRQMLRASKDLGFEIVRNADGGISFIGTLVALRQRFGEAAEWSDELIMRMQSAFGDQGLRAVSLLIGQTDELIGAWAEVYDSAGTAALAQAGFESTLSSQHQKLVNNLTAVKMTLSASLLPAIQDLVPRALEGLEALGRWSQAHPGLSRMAVLVLAIGAGILTILAPILTAASAFLVMTAAGLRAGAFIGRSMLGMRGSIGSAAGMVQTLQVRWLYAQDALQAGWGRVVSGTRAGIAAIGRAASAVGGFARSAAAAAAGGLRSLTVGVYQMGVNAIRTAVTALPGLIASTWAFTVALLANPLTWIVLAFIALGAAIVLAWKNWDKLVQWFKDVGKWFKDAGAGLWRAFTDGLKSVLMAPINVVKGAVQKIRDLLPGSDAKEGPLASLTRSGRALVTTFGGGMAGQLPDLRERLAVGLAGILPATPEPLLAGVPAATFSPVPTTARLPVFPATPTISVDLPPQAERSERPIIIQRLVVNLPGVRDGDSLVAQLRRLADEVDEGYGEE